LTAHRALEQVNVLYPREEEYQRIQAARKDGYWPYISKKEEPPADFTYGEFPLPFFAELVDFAVVNYAKRDCAGDPGSGLNPPRSNRCERMEFLDLGSGAGRLVLAAASMDTRWKRVRGVEFLTSLHELAQEKLELARSEPGLLASHVDFENASWDDKDLDLSTVDVAFAYTTALTTQDGLLAGLTAALMSKLSPETIVITTDYQLGAGFTLLTSMEGENPGVGGSAENPGKGLSTGYIFRKD